VLVQRCNLPRKSLGHRVEAMSALSEVGLLLKKLRFLLAGLEQLFHQVFKRTKMLTLPPWCVDCAASLTLLRGSLQLLGLPWQVARDLLHCIFCAIFLALHG
jgi:hypothetical protein